MKTTRGNNPETTGERRKIKKISRKGKTIQRKQDIQKQRKNILPEGKGKIYQKIYTKTYQQLDTREAKQFWGKIWQPREYNEKAERINNMGKELQGLEEGSKTKIHIDSLRTILKKLPNWKTSRHDSMHEL